MKRIRAVIWDMDGTLVASQAGNFRAYRQMFREHGLRISKRRFCEHYVCGGRTTADFLLDHASTLDPELLVARKHEIHLPQIAANSRLTPGARATLARLRAAGLAQAIASANRRVVVDAQLERCRVRHFYQAVVAGEDAARSKPHPDLFLRAAERLGVAPAACLALEDSPVGVEAACRAGMPVAAIPNGFTRAADFSRATLVLPSLHALWDLLFLEEPR
jgi:HAD superfamily hydrolase (TIGR01509 family)